MFMRDFYLGKTQNAVDGQVHPIYDNDSGAAAPRQDLEARAVDSSIDEKRHSRDEVTSPIKQVAVQKKDDIAVQDLRR